MRQLNISLSTYRFVTGNAVRILVRNELRTAGMQNTDTWAGNNDHGKKVAPGTYFCRIRARYTSGTEEISQRMVTVVR